MKSYSKFAIAGLALSATTAMAQTQIPMPAYARTFSTSIGVRGYWFEAPTDFRIVAAQVPDETGHGTQHFSIYKFRNNTPPPAFPGTTNDIVIEEYVINEDATQRIPVDVEVFSGEVIGVIGATGDSVTMHNSYGPPGTFESEILGRATTLTRSGMQFNLVVNMPMEIWEEPASPVSRVFLWVEELGSSCICDIDTSTGVGVCDVFDFLAFQDLFVQGDPEACELDTSTGPGVCDVFDFLAFQDLFVQGCP
jgi:hypothetical protein